MASGGRVKGVAGVLLRCGRGRDHGGAGGTLLFHISNFRSLFWTSIGCPIFLRCEQLDGERQILDIALKVAVGRHRLAVEALR